MSPKQHTAADLAKMMRRMLKAWSRRVVMADGEDLAELLAFQRDLDTTVAVVVRQMRETHNYSWRFIGEAAGVTRQAAQQRWGR